MNIKLNGHIITSDAYNVILNTEMRNSDPKSKNYGAVYLRPVGYYPNLRMALTGLAERSVNDCDATSVEQLLAAINRLEQAIREVGKE